MRKRRYTEEQIIGEMKKAAAEFPGLILLNVDGLIPILDPSAPALKPPNVLWSQSSSQEDPDLIFGSGATLPGQASVNRFIRRNIPFQNAFRLTHLLARC